MSKYGKIEKPEKIIRKRTVKKILKTLNSKNRFKSFKNDKIIIRNYDVDSSSIELNLINKRREEDLIFAITNSKEGLLFLKGINSLKKRKVVFLIDGKLKKFLSSSIWRNLNIHDVRN